MSKKRYVVTPGLNLRVRDFLRTYPYERDLYSYLELAELHNDAFPEVPIRPSTFFVHADNNWPYVYPVMPDGEMVKLYCVRNADHWHSCRNAEIVDYWINGRENPPYPKGIYWNRITGQYEKREP